MLFSLFKVVFITKTAQSYNFFPIYANNFNFFLKKK